MNLSSWVLPAVAVLLLAKWAAQLWLDHLNRRNVLAHAGAVPDAFKNSMDAPTYAKSIEYTLAKSRFSRVEMAFETVILAIGVVQRPFAVGVPCLHRLPRRFRLGHGCLSLRRRLVARAARAALRVARAIPPRGTLRFQHHHPKNLVAGPRQGPSCSLSRSVIRCSCWSSNSSNGPARSGGCGPGAACSPFNSSCSCSRRC